MSRTYRSSTKIPELTYRRRHLDDEKQAYRRIGIIFSLTAALVVLIFLFGIPTVRFIGQLGQKFNKADGIIQTNEVSAPSTPRLDYLPAYTNKNKAEIKGFADPSTSISLSVNDQEPRSSTSSENGSFEFLNVPLKEGQNNFKVVSVKDGKSSEESTASIIYDKKPPILELKEPADNAFFPKSTKEIKISGKTESDATITINDLQAIVNPDGTFNYTLPVSNGDNKLKVIAKDLAANQTVIEKVFKIDTDQTSSPSSSSSATTQ